MKRSVHSLIKRSYPAEVVDSLPLMWPLKSRYKAYQCALLSLSTTFKSDLHY